MTDAENPLRLLGALALTLALAACGGGGGGGGDADEGVADPSPVLSAFSASPASITAGQSATLGWNVAHVSQVRIEPGLGVRAAQGSVAVSPASTTTYTLTASNTGGTRSASVTITVLPPAAAPVIDSFAADPSSITSDGSTVLRWNTSHASGVVIDQGIGAQAADGSVTISPDTTTTYRLTATGSGGTIASTVTVTVTPPVIPPPVVGSFGAAPAAILKDNNESATLSWSVTGATAVRIDNGVGTVSASGSFAVDQPQSSITYRLTATGPGGTTSAESTLTVIDYDWTALAAALDAAIGSADTQVDGYSFALEIAGRTVFRRDGGNLDVGGIVPVVPIASATKAASAAAILAVADAGLLDLDAPVSTYLGDSITWPAAKAPITTRMLLNHTSGLPFSSDCLDDNSTTLQACAQEIADKPLSFSPGTVFLYSGAGYQLAGYVAQRAADTPWSQLFQQRIADPLGLTSFVYIGNQNPRIGGGALSNATDYLKIMRMFLDDGRVNGQQLLSAESAASVRSDQIARFTQFYDPFVAANELDGYSNGWWLTAEDSHPGSAGPEVSDPGIGGATPWMDFDRNYSAALWVVKSSDAGLAIWRTLRPIILDQINTQGLPQ